MRKSAYPKFIGDGYVGRTYVTLAFRSGRLGRAYGEVAGAERIARPSLPVRGGLGGGVAPRGERPQGGGALGAGRGSGSTHGRPPTHARSRGAAGRDRPPGRMPGPRSAAGAAGRRAAVSLDPVGLNSATRSHGSGWSPYVAPLSWA